MSYEIHDKLSFEVLGNNYSDIYVKKDNTLVHLSSSCLRITDLANAGKRGETCQEIALWGNQDRCAALNLLTQYDWNSRLILEQIGEQDFLKRMAEFGLNLEKQSLKAIKVYCPWQKVKPLTATPKKWTAETALRALANEQVKDCLSEMQFDGMTDSCDYRDQPVSAQCILGQLVSLGLGVREHDGRVHVQNSACAYSFVPAL